jgi:Tfp pilus assembly protein PilX
MTNARTLATGGRPSAALSPRSQRGVVLLIALIVLVAMSMIGLAVMRSSGSSILMAGNLSFRQNATSAGDYGIELARAWLRDQGPATLRSNATGQGYYAHWDPAFNPSTFNSWHNPGKGNDAGGNEVTYVIHRMCAKEGGIIATDVPPPPVDQECVTLADPGKTGSKGGVQYGEKALQGTAQVYYRITARVTGPKSTRSIVQAMMY